MRENHLCRVAGDTVRSHITSDLTIRYDTIRQESLTWIRKLSISFI